MFMLISTFFQVTSCYVDFIHIFPGDIMLHPLFCVHFVIEPPSKTSREAVDPPREVSCYSSSGVEVAIIAAAKGRGTGRRDMAPFYGNKKTWFKTLLVDDYSDLMDLNGFFIFFAPSKYEGIR